MYSGRYRNPPRLPKAVQKVYEPYAALKERVFVAVHIKDPKKIPVMGKVTTAGEDTILIDRIHERLLEESVAAMKRSRKDLVGQSTESLHHLGRLRFRQ